MSPPGFSCAGLYTNLSAFLLLSSLLSLLYTTIQMHRNTGRAPTGVLKQCGSQSAADHCSPSRPNNYILSTNIRDSSHGAKAKTILSHASSLFPVSLSFCLSRFPFSIWLQLLIPRQRRETEYSAPSHSVMGSTLEKTIIMTISVPFGMYLV